VYKYLILWFWVVITGQIELHAQPVIVIRKKTTGVNQDSIQKAQTEKTLILYKQNGKWGLANGNEVINTPKYDYVGTLNNYNWLKVAQNGKYGYINVKGEISVPIQYEQITDFFQGIAFAQKGYLNPLICYNRYTGKSKYVPLKNIDSIGTIFHQNLLWFAQGRKYGLLDTSGNVIANAKFLQLRPFYQERAAVKLNLWGFINTNGKIVIPANYQEVTDFSEGKAGVFNGLYWTFIDTRGKQLSKQKYEAVKNFREGYCPVKRKGSWFLIDTVFKKHFKNYFDDIKNVSENVAPARLLNKWGLIDLKGKWVLSANFEDIEPFSEGIAVAKKDGYVLIQREDLSLWRLPENIEKVLSCKNGYLPYKSHQKWGFLNKKGEVIIPAQYDTVCHFTDGLACVKENMKWACINANNQVVMPFREAKQISSFCQNIQYILLDTREENLPAFAILDTSGKPISPFCYSDMFYQKNELYLKKEGYWYKWKNGDLTITIQPVRKDTMSGVSLKYEITRTENGLKWTVKNFNEEPVFDTYSQAKLWLDSIQNKQNQNESKKYTTLTYSQGIGIIKIKEKFGCIDSVGNLIVEPKYDEITPFQNGYATVRIGNTWGMLNRKGKEVISCAYSYLGTLKERKIEFKQNEKMGFLNAEGKIVIKPEYDRVSAFSEGKAAVLKQGFWGYIDTLGNTVIPFVYTNAKPFKDSLAAVQKDFRKYGYINPKNQTVIDFNFDDAESFFEGIAFVNTDNNWVEINKKGEVQKQNNLLTNNNIIPPVEPVKIGAKWAFIDTQKRLVYPPQFDLVRHYWGDLTELIRVPESTTRIRLYGILNKRTGQIILKPDCEEIKLIHF
jgi:uncharacterized cupin superfamily protein